MRKFFTSNPSEPRRSARLAAFIFITLLIVAAITAYTVFQRLAAKQELEAEITLNHVADIRAAAISEWVLERVSDAQTFGSSRFLGETVRDWLTLGTLDKRTRTQIQERLNVLRNAYSYREVAITDSDGKTLLSAPDNIAPLDDSARQTIRQALAGNGSRLSPIHFSGGAGKALRVVEIATPLLHSLDATDKPMAALYMKADADLPLNPFVRPLVLLNTPTEILLVNVQGKQVMTMSASENAGRFTYLDVLPIRPEQLLSASRDSATHFSLTTPHVGSANAVARKIAGVPSWYLVTLIDQQELRNSLYRMAWAVAGASGTVLLLFGWALLSWWRTKESEFHLQNLQTETQRKLLQRQYDYLSKYANDMIILADADGHILEVNDKTLQTLGYQDEMLLAGKPIETLFPPFSRPLLQETMAWLRSSGAAFFEVEQQRADGTTLPVEISARAIRPDGTLFIQLICRDITERRRAEAALRENQARLDDIMASVMDVVWSLSADLKQFNYINPPGEKLYGYPIATMMQNPQLWFDAVHEEDRATFQEKLHAVSVNHPYCELEYRIVRSDHEIRWLHCRAHLVADAHGQGLRIDGVTSDITQRKAAEQQVQTLAYYDSVTMLPNRALLNDRLAQALHMAMRSHRKVALLFMDLDNFKNVNDSLGHHVGDLLLRAIGDALLQCVREEDTVGRLGGDEFLVILPDIEKGEQAVSVAEKILAAIARPFTLHDQQIHTTISIGISIFPDDGREPHELIQHADSALYQAKNHGRDNYQFFTQELNYQINRSSAIERQLRNAIDAGELSVWYQPQVDSRNGALIGAEALLRWHHAGRVSLSPLEFIPVAEERGLIGRIGEWVLRETCGQARRWQAQGLPLVPISVNVSPLQFQQKEFASLVIGILEETRLEASCLELEITESAIMRRAPLVATLAATLRDAGVGISIDDFGTGYSSLSYLKQIPIDKIKIDRSFIIDMMDDSDDEAITIAIINLARSLKLRVIAEGVESQAQLDQLRSFGCNEVQGHYYSPAVCPGTFSAFLAKRAVPAAAHS
jgi:diguanylate cyclase (GGDEF)-like protein/PAS domain S-box-containing protein